MEDGYNTNIYIDGNNLYRAAYNLEYQIDYKKFNRWLRQKFHAKIIYLFIGYISKKHSLYGYLKQCGFELIFKETINSKGILKGNCDAELVLKVISDFYTKSFKNCFLITGDGDFGCVVEFLRDNHVLEGVIAPDIN